jgi:hypothetical protein
MVQVDTWQQRSGMHGKGLWVLCPALRCLSMRTGLPLRCSAEINGSFLLAPEYVCFSAAHATMLLYTLHTLSSSAILPSAHRPTRVSVVLMIAMYSKLWAPKALVCQFQLQHPLVCKDVCVPLLHQWMGCTYSIRKGAATGDGIACAGLSCVCLLVCRCSVGSLSCLVRFNMCPVSFSRLLHSAYIS